MKRTTIQGLLIGILMLGILFRLPQLGQNSFVADEFLDINSIYGYHQTGEWRAWDFNFGESATMNQNDARDERAIVYKWQVAQLFTVLAPTEANARLVSVLWGLLSIGIVFWSTWVFTRRFDMGLVAALFTAVSVSSIIYSRRLRMYAMFFPLYLAAATTWYAAYEYTYQGKWKLLKELFNRFQIHGGYLVIAMILSALSFLTHQLAVHLGLTLGAYLLIRAWQTRSEKPWYTNRYTLSLTLGFLGGVVALMTHVEWLRYFPTSLEDHFGYLRHAFRDFATLPVGVVITGFGWWYLAHRHQEKQPQASLYLGLSWLVPLTLAILLWLRNVGAQYIYFAQSFILISAAIGLVGLYEIIRTKFSIQKRNQLILLGLILIFLVPNWGYFFEENNTYHETSTGDNPNYRKVFTYLKKEKLPTDALITRNFRNYYWSGAEIAVYDFGGELAKEKLSLTEIQGIMAQHPTGWFVYSGNDADYISGDVERWVEKNLERVSNANVRGDISVYRWGR